ncbi:MAG TPA: carboxypeptidase regulatory-like domain-containing protein [Blastocatellia bacterium]|nr:carboxypeptidase regulatory-like domain-containing protein [Blastocatellia bacterium]
MNSAQLRFLSMFVLLLLVVLTGIAQTSTSAIKATAAISGRITIEGQPAQGVEVVLLRDDDWRRIDFGLGIRPLPAATTDSEGRYKLSNVAAGAYVLLAHAPAYVIQGERRRRNNSGKTLNVAENDNLENVDITMTRGGVVTGKVTDEDGRPVIAESVTIFRLDQQGKRIQTDAFEPFGREETDDQGGYRIFGVEAGRYLVAAGSSPEEINTRMGAFYRRTFHPDTTDESKAKVIEIKPGGENENVDIRIARPTKGFAASGRVIDAETGRPVPGVMIHYGILKESSSATSAMFNLVNWPTNSAGEFRLEGLSPNNYKVGVANLENSDFYSDQVDFEIVSGDVTGLEIKLSRSASISGVAVVEGSRDPAILRNLSKIELQAVGDSKTTMGDGMFTRTGTINADGTFKISPVRPGKKRIIANTYAAMKELSFIRLEHNGVEVKDLDIAAGDQVSGVRLVFGYGTAVIAGRVEIKGGMLPQTAILNVYADRDGSAPEHPKFGKGATVDERKQFMIEGLAQGAYKVRLQAYDTATGEQIKVPSTEQTVTIAGNARHEITLVLDLTKKEGDK